MTVPDARTPAHERYTMHLQLGYQRYEKTFQELCKVRKLNSVCDDGYDAQAANEIADLL